MQKEDILKKAQSWLSPAIDLDTQNQIKYLIDNDFNELTESFYKDLEFGTGGLRGIMGVGSNRMNKYTIGMATQGLANYLIKSFPQENEIKVAIAYDTRNNSKYFAQITAEVLSANGIKVFLYDSIRPTPILSFAVRHLNCHSGIVITASHNPKEYNGYKVYWQDGGQLIAPHDTNVIHEVKNIGGFSNVNFNKKQDLIVSIGKDVDKYYIEQIKTLSLSQNIAPEYKNIKICFTPIHGSAVDLVPECLKEFGFNNIVLVDEQAIPDGNFPTVEYPNPEEAKALKMALDKAVETNADIVMGTDPDGDRVGIAARNKKGEFVLLNGNQTASILLHYVLTKWHEANKIKGKEFIVKTIVTTELLVAIAEYFKVKHYDVLTGFKYIADIIRKNEGDSQFIAGGEESYGYLIGDFVRDKDAIIACCIIAEAAAWAASQNKTLFDLLYDIHLTYGFYKEHLISLTKKGMSGAQEIAAMMDRFRNTPPSILNNSKVVVLKDLKASVEKNLITGAISEINLPKSDVLQFILEDNSKITVRPSGTEPKIKFYFSVNSTVNSIEQYEKVSSYLDEKIEQLTKELI